jgi:alkanesulfonate monooxygenase SsuD/methylene tetrahydromethanopterin reductase-like flavin-dependent oxidoreductase (luciferase family)
MVELFRFGVSLLSTGARAEWHAKVREAEDLGFDIVHVTDHLGMPRPFRPWYPPQRQRTYELDP